MSRYLQCPECGSIKFHVYGQDLTCCECRSIQKSVKEIEEYLDAAYDRYKDDQATEARS